MKTLIAALFGSHSLPLLDLYGISILVMVHGAARV